MAIAKAMRKLEEAFLEAARISAWAEAELAVATGNPQIKYQVLRLEVLTLLNFIFEVSRRDCFHQWVIERSIS